MAEQVVVGIDVSKETLDVVLQVAEEATLEKRKEHLRYFS